MLKIVWVHSWITSWQCTDSWRNWVKMTRPSHMLVRKAAWEQNEVTGGISLVSYFSLTSCPVAAVCFRYQKAGLVEEQQTIKELFTWQFPCKPSTENSPTRVIFLHVQKGEVQQFYFSFHKSVPAFLPVIWGFSLLIWIAKTYEHCHLVVISKALN